MAHPITLALVLLFGILVCGFGASSYPKETEPGVRNRPSGVFVGTLVTMVAVLFVVLALGLIRPITHREESVRAALARKYSMPLRAIPMPVPADRVLFSLPLGSLVRSCMVSNDRTILLCLTRDGTYVEMPTRQSHPQLRKKRHVPAPGTG